MREFAYAALLAGAALAAPQPGIAATPKGLAIHVPPVVIPPPRVPPVQVPPLHVPPVSGEDAEPRLVCMRLNWVFGSMTICWEVAPDF